MIEFDFIPPHFHQAQCMRTAVRTRAGLIGTMIVFMVLWVVANQREIASASAMLTEIEKQREQVSIHQEKRAALEAEQARLQQHHELLRRLEDNASVVVLIADLSQRMADTVLLTTLRFDSPSIARYTVSEVSAPAPKGKHAEAAAAPSPEEPKEPPYPRGIRLILSGMATDTTEVIAFVKQLEDSPLVGEVQMRQRGPITWAGRRGQGFELTCEVHDQVRGSR